MLETPVEHSTQSTTHQKLITIGSGQILKLSDINSLITSNFPVVLSEQARNKMDHSYRFLKSCVDKRWPIYGINTQFGDQVDQIDSYINDIDSNKYYNSIQSRQMNLIRSLVCSAGEPVAPEIIKVAMMLRGHCLSQGYSGIAPATIDAILSYLNAGIVPVVKRYGSIGASGDLIPLATIAAVLIGENIDVLYKNQMMKAPQAIELAGLKKFTPELRDGLALINGTSFMTAIASIALYNLNRLFKQMLSAIAMSLESMLVISSAYHPLVHQLKRQAGQNVINNFLIDFWRGSCLLSNLDEIRETTISNETENHQRVQDYYSLRSVCQGFGPFQENLERANILIENEMNSVNDNPIINAAAETIYHGANFMGYYVTEACDTLKMNISQASTWIHAIIANMLHPRKNNNLPTNLVPDPHINNGFRAIQLLCAALAVQNRKLAQCHQSFMLPTEGDNQDVNSLGTHAAFDLKDAVENLEQLTAALLLVSAQALELRDIDKAGEKSKTIYHLIRKCVPRLHECRPLAEQLGAITCLLKEEVI